MQDELIIQPSNEWLAAFADLMSLLKRYRYDVFINSIKNIKHAFSQKEVKLSSTIGECLELAQQ
ncbi:hypothetical protein [Colwellia sp. BRX8-9]|uniref:hypothetical protein n=1 Tax=Colwellia sp. BRX8-9 TaxID=2759831 RepID=UPI0015F6E06A|nr:hypothetical protein [Colwellia sp. BRX8-9]MBA6347182.1 hypothetical protein [Colwellia sp. BRX8-9]